MDVSNLIWCFPADFIDSLYHLPHFDLKSVMESVMDDAPDPDNLRDDLMSEIIQLQGHLKRLGYDMVYIPDLLKRTGELALDAQIQKLQKQIERMSHEENEGTKGPFEINKCSRFDIGSFVRCAALSCARTKNGCAE